MKEFRISKLIAKSSWDQAASLDDFKYPWRNTTPPKTVFKAFYDNECIHFKFIAYGPQPLVYVNTNHKIEVTKSERVEIFFRTNDKMQPYYCLEMDPKGRVLDYKANYYRKFDRIWQWPDHLHIKTEIFEEYYSLQGKLSFESLNNLGLIQDNKIEIGIYRGHCLELNGENATINWISWVDSKTPKPDFHVPSSFGKLVLT